ncbi:MAG TPA: group III truncated hemoglobin [Chitinophagaceae bacterium]|jgi:hemoglobin|nr:group III truncated hemoglobin [Chitinophagaceae bacterium]
MQDIKTLEDVKKLVDEFYGKVRSDELLGPIFEEKIGDHWDRHLDTMYRFWQTVLLDEGRTYFGNPFMKHAPLPIYERHFERWLYLWKETLQKEFEGNKVDEAYDRASKMAYVFEVKLNAIRNEGGRPVF